MCHSSVRIHDMIDRSWSPVLPGDVDFGCSLGVVSISSRGESDHLSDQLQGSEGASLGRFSSSLDGNARGRTLPEQARKPPRGLAQDAIYLPNVVKA